MSFLRTLFWIVVAVIVALFCFNNWTRVSINLWNGLILDTKLPVLMLVAFLLGLLPTLILWQATRWRLRRRIQSSEPVVTTATIAERGYPAAPISTVPPGGA